MSLRGLLLVLAATSLWGTLGPVERIALREGVTPLGVSLARGILASGLVGLTALRRRPDALRPALREIPACLGCGIFGVAGLYTLSNVAFVTIPVGLATLLFYTAPFWALLGERLLGKERLTLRRCAAFGLGLGGVWLSVGGVAGIRSGRIDPAGLLCAAGGGLSYAVYLLIGRHGIGREDPFKMYVQTFFWGTGVLALLAWGTGDLSAIRGVAGGALPSLLWLGIFPTLISYALLVRALRWIPSSTASIASMSEIAWAMGWALLLVGEHPGREALLGAGIVAAGVALLAGEGTFGGGPGKSDD